MRALLTPDIARQMGIVLLRPGPELMPIFSRGRVLVEAQPENMTTLATGLIPAVHQPLADNPALVPFFSHPDVINAAGGITGLESWLLHSGNECQWAQGDYHHHEITTRREGAGALRLCWHCDTRFSDQSFQTLADIAQRNTIAWVIDKARAELQFDENHVLTLPELCWWALRRNVYGAMPEAMAALSLGERLKPVPSTFRESDIVPSVPATSRVNEQAERVKPLIKLIVDPDTPNAQLLRPKHSRLVKQKYIQWVKTQPCIVCGNPADDAHHLIGHGQGGMGTKAHDIHVIPLCRVDHRDLHADPKAWEAKNGSQVDRVVRIQTKAAAIGVLA